MNGQLIDTMRIVFASVLPKKRNKNASFLLFSCKYDLIDYIVGIDTVRNELHRKRLYSDRTTNVHQ